MKKLSKEDLSLDKQEVSALGGSNGMKDATDGCTNPTVQTTLDSHGPICCDFSHNETCGKTCELTKCFNCPVSDNCTESADCTESYEPDCDISYDPGCVIPIPVTKDCPE